MTAASRSMAIQERVDSPHEGDRELYEAMAVLYEAMAYESLAALRHTLRLRTTAMNLRARDGNGWRAWQRATEIVRKRDWEVGVAKRCYESAAETWATWADVAVGELPTWEDRSCIPRSIPLRPTMGLSQPRPPQGRNRRARYAAFKGILNTCGGCEDDRETRRRRGPRIAPGAAYLESNRSCSAAGTELARSSVRRAHRVRNQITLQHGLTGEVRSEMDRAFMADDASPDTGIRLPEGPRRGAVSEPSRGAASPMLAGANGIQELWIRDCASGLRATNIQAADVVMDERGVRDPRYYCLPPFRGDRDRGTRHSGRYPLHLVFQGHVECGEGEPDRVPWERQSGISHRGRMHRCLAGNVWAGIHPHAVDPGSASASAAVPPKSPALSEQGAQKRRGKGEIAASQVSSHRGADSLKLGSQGVSIEGRTLERVGKHRTLVTRQAPYR
ncbi:hypothetical protein DFH09DRAFT_1110932 [Mycena vulgaris]|nr:hypothetical protein DFH09DRAFT_1110932 [Mycena vulgaris]